VDGAELPGPGTERWLRIAVIGLAIALGVALLGMIRGPHRIGDYMAETDFYGAYAEGALLIQHGQLDPSRYGVIGPFYEVLLALVGFVIRDLFLAAELLSLAATLAAMLLWFGLVRRRADGRVALIGAVLFAINTYVFRYGYSATTDAVSVALQALSLYLLLGRGGTRATLAAGLVGALAFLTRYNAVYLLPAGLLAIAAGATRWNSAEAPRRLRLLALFAGGFFAPVVPWVLFCLAHGSKFSFQLHHNIAYEVFARSKGIPWDNYQKFMQPEFHSLWDVIAKDPAAVATRMLANVYEHLRDDARQLLGPWPAVVSGAGLIFLALDARARRLWPAFAAGALLFLTLVPAFYSERYSLALVPVYATLGGIALGSPRFALPRGGVWLKALLLAVPIWFGVRANLERQSYWVTQLPTEVLEAAETLRQLKRPGDGVIARKPHLAFHAGVKALPFPFADSLPGLAASARQLGARWMYFSWPEAETRPAFWHLLDTTGVVPGLIPRRVTSPHPSVLYEIGPEFGKMPAWFFNDTLRAYHMYRARTMVEANNSTLLATRGSLARVLGHTEEALLFLQRAAALDPDNDELWVEVGAVAYEKGDLTLSVRALERVLARHPDREQARAGLGWAYFELGRMNDAATVWRPLVSTTREPNTLRRMLEVYRRLGDAGAVAEVEASIARGARR
jgi:hypothetical protein